MGLGVALTDLDSGKVVDGVGVNPSELLGELVGNEEIIRGSVRIFRWYDIIVRARIITHKLTTAANCFLWFINSEKKKEKKSRLN